MNVERIKQLEEENWELQVRLSLLRRAFRSVRVELIHTLVLNSKLKNKLNIATRRGEK